MVAAHRKMEALGIGIKATLDFPHPPPVNIGGISVLLITSHDTALAANALRHVEVETILFAWLQRSAGNQRLRRQRRDFV